MRHPDGGRMVAIEHDPHRREEEKETSRVEAFSDGVFAVAITILIFGITLPRGLPPGQTLLGALLAQWPAFLAFLTSFATIGIMWINHHTLFTHIRRLDHTLLVLNGLLLLGVTFIPFPTALVAEYIQHRDAKTAALIYSGSFTVIAILFNRLWGYASHSNRLLRRDVDQQAVEAITRSYAWGPPMYLLSFVLASISPMGSIGLNMALAVFFALPRGRSGG
jgi:uncharacterized membrane protein